MPDKHQERRLASQYSCRIYKSCGRSADERTAEHRRGIGKRIFALSKAIERCFTSPILELKASAEMLKVQTTLDQIKRDSALLVTEVESLQARRALLFKQLADVNNAHAGVEEL